MGKCHAPTTLEQAQEAAGACLDPRAFSGCAIEAPWGNAAHAEVLQSRHCGPSRAPLLGLAGAEVVPDDAMGPLGPDQVRKSDHADLQRFRFGDLPVVADDAAAGVGQMRQSEYRRLQSAWIRIAHGEGMNVAGAPADREVFRHMLRAGIGGSATFRNLVSDIGNDGDPAHRLEARVGRSQPDVIWDSFATNEVDLDDLEALRSNPAGADRAVFSREDAIAHFLDERREGAIQGSGFGPAHLHGLAAENLVRTERGAPAVVGQTGAPRPGGAIDARFSLADGRAHRMTIDGRGNIQGQVEP